MKKFTVPCQFGDTKAPFNIYIGDPAPDAHPLEQQAAWLLRERGGVIPAEVMDAFQRLHEIAVENNTSFEELCVSALGTVQESAAEASAAEAERPEVAEPAAAATAEPELVSSEHSRAQHFNRFGYLAYADPELMKSRNPEATDPGDK